eukprot:TRINITY_DN2322_c0_g1_i2.p2 TRINITY_DN2322_c0_g1~~TRINITY_DN2322_c0_g1_i2.p2  ORF type:complete len:144 (-),score=20.71 TRINITY_DN2322_c0_g1_i2:264-695(-)
MHEVKGITTATAIWISAGVGVLCGGKMFFQAIYGTVMTVVVLRYGPKLYGLEDGEEVDGEDRGEEEEEPRTARTSSTNELPHPASNPPPGSPGWVPTEQQQHVHVPERGLWNPTSDLLNRMPSTTRSSNSLQQAKSKVFDHKT